MRRKTLKGGVDLGDAHNNSSSANLAKLQSQPVVEHDFETTDCGKFVQCVKKSLRVFTIENKFIGKIIDPQTDKLMNSKILERIFDPVLRSFNVEAEVSLHARLVPSPFTGIKVLLAQSKRNCRAT